MDKATGKRGQDYYDKIKMVIDRVLEKRNQEEATIAEKYLARKDTQKTPSVSNSEVSTSANTTTSSNKGKGRGRPKRNTNTLSSPSRSTSPKPKHTTMLDLSWKDGGKNFPKRVSKVGANYQATEIPKAGTWKDPENEGSEI